MMERIKRHIIAIAACATFAACSQTNQPPDQAVQSAFDDGAIYTQIEAKFATIDADSTLHVAVAVHGGAVDLSGKARSRAVIAKFTEAAKSIGGVKSVNARLSVEPGIPNSADEAKDAALGAAVVANMAGQAGLNAASVHVSAHKGVVTLDGTVKTPAIESTLESAAKSTAGVVRVENHLRTGGS